MRTRGIDLMSAMRSSATSGAILEPATARELVDALCVYLARRILGVEKIAAYRATFFLWSRVSLWVRSPKCPVRPGYVHSTNNTIAVFDLARGTVHRKCFSPTCRALLERQAVARRKRWSKMRERGASGNTGVRDAPYLPARMPPDMRTTMREILARLIAADARPGAATAELFPRG